MTMEPSPLNFGATATCHVCRKSFSKGNTKLGTTRKLVCRKGDSAISVKYFCSSECRIIEIENLISSRECAWCGKSFSSSNIVYGGIGEPYCSTSCYNAAGCVFADLGDEEIGLSTCRTVAGSKTSNGPAIRDIVLVMAISRAVRENNQDTPPEVIAGVMLAKTDNKRNRKDLVQRPEGVYLSKECWERIEHHHVWLSKQGEIIITRNKFDDNFVDVKKDSQDQQFLNTHLPTATDLGELSSLAYAGCLASEFEIDFKNILIRNGRPIVW